MLERWQDTALNDLNLHIWNAYGHYQAFLALPFLGPDTSGPAEVRDALQGELQNGSRSHEEARHMYEGMRR